MLLVGQQMTGFHVSIMKPHSFCRSFSLKFVCCGFCMRDTVTLLDPLYNSFYITVFPENVSRNRRRLSLPSSICRGRRKSPIHLGTKSYPWLETFVLYMIPPERTHLFHTRGEKLSAFNVVVNVSPDTGVSGRLITQWAHGLGSTPLPEPCVTVCH